jgi:hypothetical protein
MDSPEEKVLFRCHECIEDYPVLHGAIATERHVLMLKRENQTHVKFDVVTAEI